MPVFSSNTRRAHTKSRAGCLNCKRRRIKCDEEKPSCKQCVRFCVACDYARSHTPKVFSTDTDCSAKVSDTMQHAPLPNRPRGRPRKNWAFNSPAMSSPSDSSMAPMIETSVDENGFDTMNLQDIELSFHYLNYTAPSLTEDCTMTQIWKNEIPRIGFSHSFVLSFLLGLSALHLARRQPERRQHLRGLAQKYVHAGFRGNTAALASLTKENGQAVYISAVLACYIHLARGPTRNECLLFDPSGQGPAVWSTMFRGIRSVHESLGSDVGFGAFQGITTDNQALDAAILKPKPPIFIPCDWRRAIKMLQQHILSNPSPSLNHILYQVAADSLAQTFNDTFESSSKQGLPPFAWLYGLDDAFVCHAQQLRPIPLILLAYFAVCLIPLEKHWFMEGWTAQIIHTVQEHIPTEHQSWLQWPLMQWEQSRAAVLGLDASTAHV